MKDLGFEIEGILHQRHLIFNNQTAYGKTLVHINLRISFVAISAEEIFKKVHELDAWGIVVIDEAVRFVDGQAADIQPFTKLMLPEVKDHALACLNTGCWKVSTVRSCLNICEGDS